VFVSNAHSVNIQVESLIKSTNHSLGITVANDFILFNLKQHYTTEQQTNHTPTATSTLLGTAEVIVPSTHKMALMWLRACTVDTGYSARYRPIPPAGPAESSVIVHSEF
jgi:hypothetical protein